MILNTLQSYLGNQWQKNKLLQLLQNDLSHECCDPWPQSKYKVNATAVCCNPLKEWWVSDTNCRVIHKEAAAYELLLKMFEPHKMFRIWVMAGLRKEIFEANKYCPWMFPGFIFPSSFYNFQLVMTSFAHTLWYLLSFSLLIIFLATLFSSLLT